ncbi:TetR/AcrR family transcriptional regulator [Labrys wisconsinensis]|uniref:AcrR family transcriptional regulator n=1 Tax=Labrys wisconsinensis TaxID=425677 RepID=A0ABU0JM90_9HYPH|nr:TetR/AcrR family transcriptional regulator [Labrys wisconsinensis]MDQ0475404.1 AcrR family transcriptional regulator [Labrys wisconsinensis]
MDTASPAVHGAAPSQPAARKTRKLDQVMAAAERCFLGQAYDSVTMDAVAREAGVSKATLYAYFPSKETLFFALVGDKCRQMEEDVWQAACAPEPVADVLKAIAGNILKIFDSGVGMALFRILVAETQRFPELGRSFYEAGPKRLAERIAAYLAEAHERGELDIDDPELAARQFLCLAHADFHLDGLLLAEPPTSEERQRMIESGIALFLAGYGRRAQA